MKKDEYCYMCGMQATSDEHVPARCFFPKDELYRKQLITVPSCFKHNEDTSLDDEYVRNAISAEYSGNHIAFVQFKNKAMKSLARNPMMLFPYKEFQSPKGPTAAFTIDRNRFDRVLRKIAYALFYDLYKKPWNRRLMIISRQLLYSDFSPDAVVGIIADLESKLPEVTKQGQNPLVFRSTILKSGDRDEDSIIRMVFYEGFTIWAMTEIGSSNYLL